MTLPQTSDHKKPFLKNDGALVCGMLAFYGLCIVGLIAATLWGLGRRNQTIAWNATATAEERAAQKAAVTATSVAYRLEQDQYEYIERFNGDSTDWFTGPYEPAGYGDVNIAIEEGVYVWDVADSRGYTQGTDFFRGSSIRDFDMYVDLKFVESSSFDDTCGGLVFRKSSLGWEDGGFVFSICDNSSYQVYFYQANDWDTIVSEYNDTIHSDAWNRIGINTRKDHYLFTINDITVFEMTDDRRKSGTLGLYVNVTEGTSSVLWFDNFGYQRR